MDKTALWAAALSSFNNRGASPSLVSLPYENGGGDFGDRAKGAEQKFHAGSLSLVAIENQRKIDDLLGVDVAPADRVRLGALVHVENLSDGRPMIFFLLPVHCTLPGPEGVVVITPKAPIGASLMGGVEGETVEARTPRGPQRMKIVKVE